VGPELELKLQRRCRSLLEDIMQQPGSNDIVGLAVTVQQAPTSIGGPFPAPKSLDSTPE
jgi:hypothetical protein